MPQTSGVPRPQTRTTSGSACSGRSSRPQFGLMNSEFGASLADELVNCFMWASGEPGGAPGGSSSSQDPQLHASKSDVWAEAMQSNPMASVDSSSCLHHCDSTVGSSAMAFPDDEPELGDGSLNMDEVAELKRVRKKQYIQQLEAKARPAAPLPTPASPRQPPKSPTPRSPAAPTPRSRSSPTSSPTRLSPPRSTSSHLDSMPCGTRRAAA